MIIAAVGKIDDRRQQHGGAEETDDDAGEKETAGRSIAGAWKTRLSFSAMAIVGSKDQALALHRARDGWSGV